ncbi:hypothetical protein [Fodinibius sediminis]|uniref:hypothetical protein n=1 Tax=Fodinibius sediminis TaxID=1214077 RepID=UPI001C8F8BB4|nr:hypothetical protein [Fodinibius sediminis]
MYIFKPSSIEEARTYTATDPAVKAGRLEVELYTWYGSAAMLKIPEIHKQLRRKNP